ncbi:MAG: AI-2E family transporter [Candidatus Binatia bacterium]
MQCRESLVQRPCQRSRIKAFLKPSAIVSFSPGASTPGSPVCKSIFRRAASSGSWAILRKMDGAIGEFFRGRLVVSVIMGVLLSAGWFLAGVPYWFFLGMLTGFLNIVPYLSVISWPVAILLTYVEGISGSSGQSISLIDAVGWPSAVYVLVQLLENWVLTPWIQSGQTNMNAAAILLVVFIGGSLAGVWGLLFAIPIAACVKILLDEVLLPNLRNRAATH